MSAGTEVNPPARDRRGAWRVLVGLLRRPRSAFGLIVIVAMVAAAVLAPWIMPYDPNDQMFDGLSLEGAPLPPSAKFWLGTDLLGRDLFSRLVLGTQTSLIIGVLANGIAVVLGATVGITPSVSRPDSPERQRAAASSRRISSATRRAWRSTSCPAGVSTTRRGCRSTSWAPNCASSSLICMDSAGCVTCIASAARPKCPASARAMK